MYFLKVDESECTFGSLKEEVEEEDIELEVEVEVEVKLVVEGEQSGEYKRIVQPVRSVNKDRELGPGKE